MALLKRRRKLVAHAFSAHAVAAMANRVAQLCRMQLDTFSEGGDLDLAVPALPRVVTEDTELSGKTIAKDSLVFLCWASCRATSITAVAFPFYED